MKHTAYALAVFVYGTFSLTSGALSSPISLFWMSASISLILFGLQMLLNVMWHVWMTVFLFYSKLLPADQKHIKVQSLDAKKLQWHYKNIMQDNKIWSTSPARKYVLTSAYTLTHYLEYICLCMSGRLLSTIWLPRWHILEKESIVNIEDAEDNRSRQLHIDAKPFAQAEWRW